MEQLIQFRLSVQTLTQNEYQQLITSINKHDMVQALFDYYMKELHKIDCPKIKDINQKISAIINARSNLDVNATDNILLPAPQLDNIGTPLINYIDSFLDDNINFQRTCRQIYIASKSPQHIHYISPLQIEKYINYCTQNNSIININKFNRVSNLSLDFKGLKLWNDNGFTANGMRQLGLYGFRNREIELKELNKLISLNTTNLNTVTHLLLNLVDFSQFPIIEQMANLKYLQFNERTIIVQQLNEKCKSIIQSLKGITIIGIPQEEEEEDDALKIMDYCGCHLESLHVYILEEKFKKFVNIKELFIDLNNVTQVVGTISIINNFVKLKTIQLGTNLCVDNINLFQDEMLQFLNALFNIDSLETVRFLIFRCSQWQMICTKIQQSLMTIEKSKLNISIEMRRSKYETINKNIHIHCLSLANGLYTAVKNFMFRFRLKIYKWDAFGINETIMNNLQKWLDNCKQKVHVEYNINQRTICFVLCNKHSTINGYSEIGIFSGIEE